MGEQPEHGSFAMSNRVKKKSPAFQFYVKDWLSSYRILSMTPAEEGAYIRLLAYCWDSGDCSIPDDDEELAAMSRLAEGWLNGSGIKLRKQFKPHPSKPGYLTNARLLEEALKQLEWSEKSSTGGKNSAAQRAVNARKSKGGSSKNKPPSRRPVEPHFNTTSASSSASASASAGGSTSQEGSSYSQVLC